MEKNVKIIGLSIKQGFGALKATELAFDEHNRLTLIKGEVGAGKTTFKRAAELVTKGSGTLEDKNLYGEVDIETQLLDGDRKVFVGCKTDSDGKLSYSLYEYDDKGKKIQNPVIDGVKATPAAYLKELQTKLTWRLEELTSENPVTQRNLLLELYANELEAKGVVFNKKSPNYVGSIIDQIEKAKERRSYLDMLRKEVGGIADDLRKKGIDTEEPRVLYDINEVERKIADLNAKISHKKLNVEQEKKSILDGLKLQGIEISSKLKDINNQRKLDNDVLERNYKELLNARKSEDNNVLMAVNVLKEELPTHTFELVESAIKDYHHERIELTEPTLKKTLVFNEKGSIISDPKDWVGVNEEVYKLLVEYRKTLQHWQEVNAKPLQEVNTTDLQQQVGALEDKLKLYKEENKITKAVNCFLDWKEQNEHVNSLNKEYFLKLTEINTGVEGLKITPEYKVDEKGEKVALGNDIFLMYDGSYDPVYFSNYKQELRKLSAYSDTQKPMICLLVQQYLLRKKTKKMPYLWIDQVPLDNKTIDLLKRMSEELGLWLFVNWTGDFNKDELQSGEILIENGEIFFN